MHGAVQEILIFEVAGQRHGLSVSAVQELLPALAMMPLPDAPVGISGVINLRGAIVPVIELRRRFGLPARPMMPSDHFIVIRAVGRPFALHVDHALELVQLSASAVGAVEMAERQARVVKWRDGMVLLHTADDLAMPAAGAGKEGGPA